MFSCFNHLVSVYLPGGVKWLSDLQVLSGENISFNFYCTKVEDKNAKCFQDRNNCIILLAQLWLMLTQHVLAFNM